MTYHQILFNVGYILITTANDLVKVLEEIRFVYRTFERTILIGDCFFKIELRKTLKDDISTKMHQKSVSVDRWVEMMINQLKDSETTDVWI